MDPKVMLILLAIGAGAYGARKTSEAAYKHVAKPAYHFFVHPVATLTGKGAKGAAKAVKAAAKHQAKK